MNDKEQKGEPTTSEKNQNSAQQETFIQEAPLKTLSVLPTFFHDFPDNDVEAAIPSELPIDRSMTFSPQSKRFLLKQKLGEGAAGIVWQATDQDFKRMVAIKTFKRKDVFGKKACAHEIRLAGKLEHPGIPPIHDVGLNEKGHYYFVMKYAQGEPLSKLISNLQNGDPKTHQQYPFHRRAELIIQLLRILVATHKEGILHRDIKPENILIGPSAELQLMDWGIALDLSTSNGKGDFCGTPFYMSPEQLNKEALDARSDLYSVAAVFYQLTSLYSHLANRKTLEEVRHSLQNEEPMRMDLRKHPHQGYPPSEYRLFIHRGLSKNPQDRFHDATEMLTELERIQSGYIKIVCNRTTIKSLIYQYMRLLDKNPYISVTFTYLFLLCGTAALLSLGIIIGIQMAN